MGSNRRYAEHLDRLMAAREGERVIREGGDPDSLQEKEVDAEHFPVTRAKRAVSVQAWVRYGRLAVWIRGEAVAWNERAVAVRWRAPDGSVHRAWLWASAVTREEELRRGRT